ncbi:amidohydrolase family protein [Thiolapillus sp.]
MAATQQAKAMEQTKERHIVFKNVRIFDGSHETLIDGKKLLVTNNKITRIAADLEIPGDARVIDGGGRILMPGLIDAHTHLMVTAPFEDVIYKQEPTYVGAVAVKAARAMLMRGFTTARDAGGPVSGLKRAIDEGIVPGPRIFPSNAFISQTAGHGDFDSANTYLSPYFTGALNKAEVYDWVKIADGVPEVQKATREVLRSGASQIKVMASGSITGAHDPIDVTEYTLEELKAIVTEAAHWGTYVMVHAYSDQAVRNAIEAGVKSIEHGLLVEPETLKLMKEKGIWLSTQCISYSKEASELGLTGTPAEAKFNEAKKGAERTYALAKKYGLKLAWGTDTFGSLEMQATQSEEFRARAKYFSSPEILRQATSLNGQLLALSGKRTPYPDGKLGVIEEGAYADLLIVDGNPLQDVTLLADPASNIHLIMKDGEIYKNTLPQE